MKIPCYKKINNKSVNNDSSYQKKNFRKEDDIIVKKLPNNYLKENGYNFNMKKINVDYRVSLNQEPNVQVPFSSWGLQSQKLMKQANPKEK